MKIRLTIGDLFKILFGGRVLVKTNIWDKVIEVKRGKTRYITR